MSERDDRLAALADALMDAVAAQDSVDTASWAARFELEVQDVERCLRAVRALAVSLGEDPSRTEGEAPLPSISGDFELGVELGRGGMGVVYRAQQKSLGRSVAVKVLRHGAFDSAVERFRAEARSLARLRHPHIVSIHGVGETDDGLVYYTMDLVEGRTLADEMAAAGGALTPSRAVKIARQVTSAIAHAHSQGIVHRDLKPQNILIDHAGDAFVVDFGLARDAAAGPVTMTGELLGTPAYMSPEQARGDQALTGEASDVWAMGALLYEMLTGRGPFSGLPLHETIRAILEDAPTPLRRIDKRVPAALEAVTLLALRKRPEQRYASAAALAEDLERFVEGVSVVARRPGPTERLMASMAQHRSAWLASVVTVALSVAFVLVAVIPGVRRGFALESARSLLAAGEPDACLAVLDPFEVSQTPRPRGLDPYRRVSPWNALRARAMLDRAGELWATRDNGAGELGRRAFELLGGRTTIQGRAPQFESSRIAWDFLRASMFARMDVDPTVRDACFDRDHWRESIGSPNAGEREMAWLVASRCAAKPALFGGVGSGRVELLLGLHEWWGRDLERARYSGSQFAPLLWTPEAIVDWWSPEAEDRLADLIEDESVAEDVRALACRSWTVLVGLGRREDLIQPEPIRTRLAAVLDLGLVERWRQWRGMPRDEALSGRMEALLEFALKDRSAATVLSAMCGAGPREDARAAAQRFAADPHRWLKARLSHLHSVDARFALQEASGPAAAERLLWRSLAYLELSPGSRVPMALPDQGNWPWSDAWYRAAGVEPERRLVASVAVLQIDDLELQPTIVEERNTPMAVGESIELEFRRKLPFRPFAPAGSRFDGRQLGDDRTYSYASDLRASRRDDGAARVTLRLELVDDAVVLRYRRTMGPFFRGSASGSAIRSGSATVVGYSGLFDVALDRHVYQLLVVRLHSRDDPTHDVEAWRQAMVQRVRAAPRDRADLCPALWLPLPEVGPELQRRAERAKVEVGDGSRFLWGGAWLAGAAAAPGDQVLPRTDTLHHTSLARIAVHAPDPGARQQAIEELAALARGQYGKLYLSNRTIAQLDESAADEQVMTKVRSCAAAWRRSKTVQAWGAWGAFALLVGVCAFGIAIAARRQSWSKRLWRMPLGSTAMVTSWIAAAFLVHNHFVLGGVSVLPMWAALGVWAVALALPFGLRASPWVRNAAVFATVLVAMWECVAHFRPAFEPPNPWWAAVPYLAAGALAALTAMRRTVVE